MRREIDWLVAGLSIVAFAFATAQARIAPIGAAPVVIDLRADDAQGVVLKLDQSPQLMLSSLAAGNEEELFGIKPEPPIAVTEPETMVPAPVKPKPAKLSAPARRVAPKATALAAAPAAVTAVGPMFVELDVPKAMTPGRAVTFAEEAPASQLTRERLGFRLNERTSINLAPLSSVVPSYAAETGHGDMGERWRLRDEDAAAGSPGAAVGMTFKLN